MTPAPNLSKQNATITDHMCITDQERSVGGQCPVNHRSTTLKSLKCPENTKRNILWWRPRRRGELVQADKLIGVGCGGEAFIGAGETAIKTLFTGGWSVLEVHQSCSLREIVGILPNGFGDRRSGMVIPGSEQVATDSKAACHVRPMRAITSVHGGSTKLSKTPALIIRHSNASMRARVQKT